MAMAAEVLRSDIISAILHKQKLIADGYDNLEILYLQLHFLHLF